MTAKEKFYKEQDEKLVRRTPTQIEADKNEVHRILMRLQGKTK